MSFDLKLHAYRLLMDEPFFAALSRKIEKRADYKHSYCWCSGLIPTLLSLK
jgi:hypothetical protein